jgi:hypothetical protein
MTSCLLSNDQLWDGTVRIRISVCHNLGAEAVLTGSVDNGVERRRRRRRWWWWCGTADEGNLSTVDRFKRHATSS